jgi:hypothetical protein
MDASGISCRAEAAAQQLVLATFYHARYSLIGLAIGMTDRSATPSGLRLEDPTVPQRGASGPSQRTIFRADNPLILQGSYGDCKGFSNISGGGAVFALAIEPSSVMVEIDQAHGARRYE